MKKMMLFVVLCLAAISAAAQANFSFTAPEVDSFTEGYYTDPIEGTLEQEVMRSYVVNNNADTVRLFWNIITGVTDRPNAWIFTFAFDNVAGRSGETIETPDTFKLNEIPPGDSAIFEVHVGVSVYDDSGIGYFYIRVFDSLETHVDTLRLRLHKLVPALPRPTGIDQLTGDQAIQFFPNPAKKAVFFKTGTASKAYAVTVTDATGKKVRNELLKPGVLQHSIPLNALLPGVYWISVTDQQGQKIVTRKILKE